MRYINWHFTYLLTRRSAVAHFSAWKKLPRLLWGPLFGRTCWTCLNPPLFQRKSTYHAKNSRSDIKFQEFSRLTKFQEFSRFSRSVGTLTMYISASIISSSVKYYHTGTCDSVRLYSYNMMIILLFIVGILCHLLLKAVINSKSNYKLDWCHVNMTFWELLANGISWLHRMKSSSAKTRD